VPCFSANEITVLENRNISTRKPYHFASENNKKVKAKMYLKLWTICSGPI